MAYVETPWGYSIDGGTPDLMSLADFHALTGNALVGDARIQRAIDAVTARLRSWCGWHVATSAACSCVLDGHGTTSLWLPSTHVTSVSSVTVCGVDVTDSVEWSDSGLIRLPYATARLRGVEVEYTSGYGEVPEELMALVAHRVLHQVMVPLGIQSETIGTTSRTYANGAADGLGSAHLSQSDYVALTAYRRSEVS